MFHVVARWSNFYIYCIQCKIEQFLYFQFRTFGLDMLGMQAYVNKNNGFYTHMYVGIIYTYDDSLKYVAFIRGDANNSA